MSMTRRTTAITASVLLGLALAACETTPQATTEAAAGPSPVNQRELDKQAAWTEAIAGLSFDTGMVVVQNPPDQSNRAQALRMMEQGQLAMAGNNRTPAVHAYADAVRVAPDMPEAYFGLGQAMTAKGRTDMAIASFRTVTNMQPDNIDAHVELATALWRDSHSDQAIAAMEDVLNLDPTHGYAHERLAIWYYFQNDYSSAWDHVNAARNVGHPMPPQFINNLNSAMPEPTAR